MKKHLLVVFTILLVLSILSVPVFAAEKQEEYVFDSVDKIADFMPPGNYIMTVERDGRKETMPIAFKEVSRKESEDSYTYILQSGSVPFLEEIFAAEQMDSLHLIVCVRSPSQSQHIGATLGLTSSDGRSAQGLYGDYYFSFVPVDSSGSGASSISLADYISSESFSSLLDQIISLLPVVLAVIVGYIALRKAIAWLMSVMRSS